MGKYIVILPIIFVSNLFLSRIMASSNFTTLQNLEAAFGGESMANRKYLFFAEVARKLGFTDLAKLFRETAEQETEHAFAHFRLLHPELVIEDPTTFTETQKKEIVSRCLSLAIEGETYEYTTMYPEFATTAESDCDNLAAAEFRKQVQESTEHAKTFHQAAHQFGLLKFIENYHADRYAEALAVLNGGHTATKVATQKWICRQCSMIYDPATGDPDSGIAPGTPFTQIPDDWHCPICGASKKTFIPFAEPTAA